MNQVKADVLPFVRNPHGLDIWSNDYFVQLDIPETPEDEAYLKSHNFRHGPADAYTG